MVTINKGARSLIDDTVFNRLIIVETELLSIDKTVNQWMIKFEESIALNEAKKLITFNQHDNNASCYVFIKS